MQILKTILIVCFLNTSAFSQSDSLCFTHSQVRTFLTTKVELTNCIESSKVLIVEMESIRATNEQLSIDYIKSKKRLRRTRFIAGGGIITTILLSMILIL